MEKFFKHNLPFLEEQCDEEEQSWFFTILDDSLWIINLVEWPRLVSLGVIEFFLPYYTGQKIKKPSTTKPGLNEHAYPRKLGTTDIFKSGILLRSSKEIFNRIVELTRTRLVVPKEHKRLTPLQREGVFTTPDRIYAEARVPVFPLEKPELQTVHFSAKNQQCFERKIERDRPIYTKIAEKCGLLI